MTAFFLFLTPSESDARAAWRRGLGRSRASQRRRTRRHKARQLIYASVIEGARRGYSDTMPRITRWVLE